MPNTINRSVCALLFLFILAACNSQRASSRVAKYGKTTQAPKSFAIKDVTVIPMSAADTVIAHAVVVIEGNKIVSINGPIPKNAKVINGRGKWLIPGLIDMHVHIPTDGNYNADYPTRTAVVFANTQDVMTPFIAAGVTTVLELNAQAGHFGQRNEILRGDVIGPRMALAALINGGDGNGRNVNSPADGRQAVRSAKAEGYSFVKVYSQLNAATYFAVVDEAGKLGMKVVGHIPNAFRGKIADAFVPHFDMVAHAEEFFKQTEDGQADPKVLAQMTKANGTWVTPTLVIMESALAQSRSIDAVTTLPELKYVHPLLQSKWTTANNYHKNGSPETNLRFENLIAYNNRLVKAFKEADVPIVAGTDAGSSGVVWGFSLHDELALLVKAGLSPKEALAAATRVPAAWLGLVSKTGTIEPGKFADLVLLDANPLQDINNTRKIAGVFVNGRWLDKKEIARMLADLAKRNAAGKNNWDWQKRAEY